MTSRRGNTTGETIAYMLLMAFAIGALVITGAYWYRDGYRDGQIDALEGTVKYASVETEAGTFWYTESKPKNLYARRKKKPQ